MFSLLSEHHENKLEIQWMLSTLTKVPPTLNSLSNSICDQSRRFPSCISPLIQSESCCEAFHMEISFIHTQSLVHLHVNKTNFHVKGFALGTRFETEAKGNSKIAYLVKLKWMSRSCVIIEILKDWLRFRRIQGEIPGSVFWLARQHARVSSYVSQQWSHVRCADQRGRSRASHVLVRWGRPKSGFWQI